MKRILVFYLIILLFFVSATASVAAEVSPSATPSAEVLNLPLVHLLPDNPLYFLKTLKEKLQLLLARNTSRQAELLLSFAQKRLAEALAVSRKGKIHIGEKLFEAFGQDIKRTQEKIAQAKARGERTYHLWLKLQKTVASQKAVIEKLQAEADRYPEEVRLRIEALRPILELEELPQATESGKIESRREKKPGLGIGEWLRNLLGPKEILSPLAR